MYNKNICLLINKNNDFNSFYISNFVLETTPSIMKENVYLSTYRIYLVADGSGTLILNDKKITLNKGDIFIGLPTFNISFIPRKDFKYFYISFLGSKASYYIDKLKVNKTNCIFRNFYDLIFFYQSAIKLKTDAIDIKTESVILYTFSNIIGKNFNGKNNTKKSSTAEKIKKYIDENFYNPNLSLDIISKNLAYNKKYISTIFKNFFQVNITEYILDLRIKNAISLIEYGVTSVKNISSLSGFSDPLYFSKLFKKTTGLSPKQKIKSLL